MDATQPLQQELFSPPPRPRPDAEGLFAQIVFDRPLDQAYTYRVPESLSSAIAIGKRVRAPFGRGDCGAVGFCVGLTEEPPPRDVKDLRDVLDEEPLLSDNLLRLTRWMADYYLCGWGQVLNAVVPAGAKKKSGTREAIFLEAVPQSRLAEEPPKLTKKQIALLEILRKQPEPIEIKKCAALAGCGARVLQSLVQKGYAVRSTKRIDIAAKDASAKNEDDQIESEETGKPIQLNADQRHAWNALDEAVQKGGFRPHLLYGVTGSGKTELYLKAIEKVLAQGKQALVLVPEISLTPQTIQRFRGRCGEVAVLHSHLRDAARGSQWRRIKSGQVQVIVGARSAVFAPADNLGLIVIDEEHEGSFKEESTPRYSARDVAVMRSRLENIPIILGSATPSLESWHNAERGQYSLLTLPNRVLDLPMPKVRLIDLRHDVPRGYRPAAISPELERAMRNALFEGGQVILLLNRRGYSTHVHCPACGHVETCRFCDLALTYHQRRDVNLCHYCGYEQEPPKLCSACGKVYLRYQGLGTEKLEREIEKKFTGYVVRRMDSDTMKKPGSHRRLLDAFRRGEVHILLGTQMIAKGLDFPNVNLVGVVNADIALHLPDFRAAERTFQLLSQVAGRAGRGPRGGKVLIQTFNPENPAIVLATRHDYLSFVETESAHRREHNYPPYQRLIRIIIRSRKPDKAEHFADRMAEALEEAKATVRPLHNQPMDLRILGPAEAAVFRLKGYYRFHLQLQSASPGLLHQVLREVISRLRIPSGVDRIIDVDPLNMM